MPHPPEQRCANCLSFVPSESDPTKGECHRDSPKPVTLSINAYDSRTAPSVVFAITVWPPVPATEWCREYAPDPVDNRPPAIETAIAAEREACAIIADGYADTNAGVTIADEIRARGNHE